MILNFTVHGKPLAKQRPRFTRQGHAYTPDSTVMYENLIKTCFSQKYPDHVPATGGVKMNLKAYYPIPTSWSRKKQYRALENKIHPMKPDLDNLYKIVADALNLVAYHDDAQIYAGNITKEYGVTPRVEITIEIEETEEADK